MYWLDTLFPYKIQCDKIRKSQACTACSLFNDDKIFNTQNLTSDSAMLRSFKSSNCV